MTRISQSTIEDLILDDNPIGRSVGRLLATEFFSAFEKWLDEENPRDADRAIEILEAVIVVAVYLIRGVASESFRDNERSATVIKALVQRKMEAAFNVPI